MVHTTLPIEVCPNSRSLFPSLVLFWPLPSMLEARSCGMTCVPVCIPRTITCVRSPDRRARCYDSWTCKGDYRQRHPKWKHYARWEFCNVRTPYYRRLVCSQPATDQAFQMGPIFCPLDRMIMHLIRCEGVRYSTDTSCRANTVASSCE